MFFRQLKRFFPIEVRRQDREPLKHLDMRMDKTRVKKILVISLSNIGDAILTTPVIEVLRKEFPQAHLALLVGTRAFDVFKSDRRLDAKIIYDKSICWKNKLGLLNRLRHDRYDLIVDLRHTAMSIFLGARYRTSIFGKPAKSLTHMQDRHLWKLKSLGLDITHSRGPYVEFSESDRDCVNQMFKQWQFQDGQKLVAIAPGARNMTKRWDKEGYRQLISYLSGQYKVKVVVVGDAQDELLVDEIIAPLSPKPFNAAGKTSIAELALLLTKCSLLIANDSAPMHLGWAMNTPVVAIFGPTSDTKYAPRGKNDIVIRKQLPCTPCEQSLCPKGTRECMKLISADEVFAACKKILDAGK